MNNEKTILLCGNPNVGKTSIFNNLTLKKEHVGNWTGKTVSLANGYLKNNKNIKIIDLPGTYSLLGNSDEEIIARDAILFTKSYKNIIVINPCFLERNLPLVLQILEISPTSLLCLNFKDELDKNNITLDIELLSNILGTDIVLISSREEDSLKELTDKIIKENKNNFNIYYEELEEYIEDLSNLLPDIPNKRFISLKLLEGDKSIVESIYNNQNINVLTEDVNDYLRNINFDDVKDKVSKKINELSKEITEKVINYNNSDINKNTRIIDKIITSKKYGIPLSILLFTLIFYITISFANYPSELLSSLFNLIGDFLLDISTSLSINKYIYGPLINGVYKTVTWVIAVMLPPMAIFFPLYGLLEESGLLPRIAFNFDKCFQKSGTSGKQCLTMCMGFGCNACGVVGTRIIESPKDKIIACITNNFIPCNGRFPLIITLVSIFFVKGNGLISNIYASLIVTLLILISIIVSLIVSKILSLIILKKASCHFSLELPIYRKPKVFNVIYRSIVDKTISILLRALKISTIAGLIIWILANTNIGNNSLIVILSDFLNPFAKVIGLDGVILLSFILALPANEIVLPIILMGYLNNDVMIDFESKLELKNILINNGWNLKTALSVCIFSLMHFPCATTLWTIKKEIGKKWMYVSFIVPTICGIIILLFINIVV